jgi:hypothetical protein
MGGRNEYCQVHPPWAAVGFKTPLRHSMNKPPTLAEWHLTPAGAHLNTVPPLAGKSSTDLIPIPPYLPKREGLGDSSDSMAMDLFAAG